MQSKSKSRQILSSALSTGKIKSEPCEVCGKEKTEGHHDDYAQPLKVRWLCRKHHREWHNENGFQKFESGDTMIRISPEVRQKLKMQALKIGLTLKEYLSQLAEKNNK